MKHSRLLELMGYTLAIVLAASVPLCLRLRYLYQVGGVFGLEDKPLTVWLPVSMYAALATYVLVVAILVPKRLFFSLSVMLFAMTFFLILVKTMFGDIGPTINQMIIPYVVHLVLLGSVLVITRLLGYRFARVDRRPEAFGWQYSMVDLLMLTTALALFLATGHWFDYFRYSANDLFLRFLWLFGGSMFLTSLPAVWGRARYPSDSVDFVGRCYRSTGGCCRLGLRRSRCYMISPGMVFLRLHMRFFCCAA